MGVVTFSNVYGILERQKSRRTDKDSEKNDIYNRYQSGEKLLVAGSLQDRKDRKMIHFVEQVREPKI